MWRMERHVPCRGGGNGLKPSHNHGLHLFLGCLDAKMHRGKVCYDKSSLRANAKQSRKTVITRSDKRRSNPIHLIPHLEIKKILLYLSQNVTFSHLLFGRVASGGHGSYQCLINVDKRLRNKCAMTCFGNMNQNIFNDKDFSLKQAGATHVALCDSVGSYFRHWCAAFTLAEVLITLGIIGVVAAMTMPALIANTKKSEISAKLKKFNTTMAQCVLLSEQDNGPAEEWTAPGEYDTFDLDSFFKTYLAPYIKYSNAELKTEFGTKHYYVYLLDGGYFYFQKGNCIDIIYDVNGNKKPNAHGRDTFRFLMCGSQSPEWCDGRHFCPMYSTSAHTREEKIQDCLKGDRGSGCTGLLEYDGWEFKKDYPIRL